MYTRSSLRRKRPADGPQGDRDRVHLETISNLKREILELKNTLNEERARRTDTLRERGKLCTACLTERKPVDCTPSRTGLNTDKADDSRGPPIVSGLDKRVLYELDLCKKDLEESRRLVEEVCEEREALRVKLTEAQRMKPSNVNTGDAAELGDVSHPHLDWVGRNYLAVSLPEDRMFKPGEPVTPVGVLQKLFEMRVGEKHASGFSVLIENVNIMISQTEPEWYAKHFGFCSTRVHANGYSVTQRLDTEDFVWLLFEYGAHAPMIEVIAGLLTVLSSAGKGGVTATALCTSKSLYSSYVTLFRDTVTMAYERFRAVRDRAQKVRAAQGLVYVPVTAGLPCERIESGAHVNDSFRVKSAALRSILEGIEVPPHISTNSAQKHQTSVREDPFRLDQSLAHFLNKKDSNARCRQGADKEREWSGLRTTQDEISATDTSRQLSSAPLVHRVLFDSPWSQ